MSADYEKVPDFVTPLQEKRRKELESFLESVGVEKDKKSGIYGVHGLAYALKYKYEDLE